MYIDLKLPKDVHFKFVIPEAAIGNPGFQIKWMPACRQAGPTEVPGHYAKRDCNQAYIIEGL